MRTTVTRGAVRTVLPKHDEAVLAKLVTELGPFARPPRLGTYRTMNDAETWLRIVSQVCVMGSSRGMAAITGHRDVRADFVDAVEPRRLLQGRHPVRALAGVLTEFRATRFAAKSAGTLITALRTRSVFDGRKFRLLEDLPKRAGAVAVRDVLMERCPIFRLKSASDFMINTGLSHDVIALDVRVVGVLRRYLGFNLAPGKVQSRRAVYLSVEDALRGACERSGHSLAHLDRVLFKFSAMSALEFALTRVPVVKG
jgi:thermostable 8-oxoguanine DNA glycosylase